MDCEIVSVQVYIDTEPVLKKSRTTDDKGYRCPLCAFKFSNAQNVTCGGCSTSFCSGCILHGWVKSNFCCPVRECPATKASKRWACDRCSRGDHGACISRGPRATRCPCCGFEG